MVDTITADEAAKKWASRISVSTADFSAGVQRSRGWQAPTLAAKENWATGVSNAVANDKFSKGVSQSSDSEWKTRTSAASSAWSSGAARSTDRMRTGIGKTLAVIQGVSLPARGPRGSDGNYERVRAIGRALHEQLG